ncbi:MAG: hypothetical protein U9O94_10505 [Nanoarchaeota archaeon]|nr:hypothetical protein [Nanoarchaeota archaeon]
MKKRGILGYFSVLVLLIVSISVFAIGEIEDYTLYWDGSAYALSGEYTSEPISLGYGFVVTSITWTEDLPSGTDIRLQISMGESEDTNDGTWTSFVGPGWNTGTYFTNPAGGEDPVQTENRFRFVQYKAYLSTTNNQVTPTLSGVRINYDIYGVCVLDSDCISGSCKPDLLGGISICTAVTSCNYNGEEQITGFSVCYNSNSYICNVGSWDTESCQNPCDYYKDVNTCLPSGLCEGCPSSCTSDDDCDANGHCNGECVADLGAGSDCIDDSDCESNSCRDDYDGGRFCAVDPSSCVHDPPGYAPASYPSGSISDEGNFYCNSQGVWEDIDASSTACTTLEMSWLSSGIGTNANCCGDDLNNDDFEQDALGGSACIDGMEISHRDAVNSFLVSDGQIYSCNSQSTYTFDTDHFDVTCTAVDGKYCNDDNNWKTTKSGACGCGTGSECSTGLCINGACRSSCEGYTQSVSKCSDDEIPYTSEESGVCVHNNSVYYCDTNEVADIDASQALELVDDCAIGDYRDQCDGDYQGDFDVDGVCGNTNNEICIDNWAGASQQTDGSIPTRGQVGSTEYDICFGNGGDYCDYVGDGGWTPLDRRCDSRPEDDIGCRSCNLETGMDSEGLCEEDCGAPSITDEELASSCYGKLGYISSDCIYYDDPDSNKETCECMEDIGYWDMGGEVAADECCNREEGQFYIESLIGGGVSCCNQGTDCVDSLGRCQEGLIEICGDGQDNDCDGESDFDTLAPQGEPALHGDVDCPIQVTEIAVSEDNPLEDSTISVYCTVDIPGINSVDAYVGTTSCLFNSWENDDYTAVFDCGVGNDGIKDAKCTINPDKSYQFEPDKLMSIDVRPNDCSGYDVEQRCGDDIRCDWCPGCFGATARIAENSCVPAGQCSYACQIGKCGADCDLTNGGNEDYPCDWYCVQNTLFKRNDIPTECPIDTCVATPVGICSNGVGEQADLTYCAGYYPTKQNLAGSCENTCSDDGNKSNTVDAYWSTCDPTSNCSCAYPFMDDNGTGNGLDEDGCESVDPEALATDPDSNADKCADEFTRDPLKIKCEVHDTKCWSEYTHKDYKTNESFCCGDDGVDECWLDTASNACCWSDYISDELGMVVYLDDADESSHYCNLLSGTEASSGPCDVEGETDCWDTNLRRCCGDDGDYETWEHSTNTVLDELLVQGTCYNGKWIKLQGANNPIIAYDLKSEEVEYE